MSAEIVRRGLAPPVAAIRPYLLLKGTLLLLAFDMWLTRASHAGRYGAGGFNVAHFPWLDAAQPAVSPPFYVGACVLTGALCFAIVFARRPPRWLLGLTFVVHTWSWAMSMLDSYQHHYLLSIVLLCLAFFPGLNADEALEVDAPPQKKGGGSEGKGKGKGKGRKSRKKKKAVEPEPEAKGTASMMGWVSAPYPFVSAWAYSLLCLSTAVVYGYTAYAKTDPEWLSGAAFRRVIRYPAGDTPPVDDPLSIFRALLEPLGFTGETFWYAMGHSVVLVQIVCMAGYLLSPWRDRAPRIVTHVFFGISMLTALSFHFGAEDLGLEIGWFSWYMILYALVCMLPAQVLVGFGRAVFRPMSGDSGSVILALRFVLVGAVMGLAAKLDSGIVLGVAGLIAFAAPLRFLSHARWVKRLADLDANVTYGLSAAAALLLVAVGWWVDLPGAREATVIAAVLGGASVVYLLVTGRDARALHGVAVGTLIGALALGISVASSEMRWDYWRNVGGDHRRRGEVEEAYVAYVKANRYAPEGEDRDEQQQEMREILERRGVLPPSEDGE